MSAGLPVALFVLTALVGTGLGPTFFRITGVTEERAQGLTRYRGGKCARERARSASPPLLEGSRPL
jgi:hypothetical protein